MTEKLVCNQENCDDEATHRIYWPGEPQPLPMCALHSKLAQKVLGVLGTPAPVEKIIPPMPMQTDN